MRYTPPPGSTDPDAPYVTGVPGVLRGSPVPAEAVEDPQREIVNAIKAAGLEPDKDDLTQLSQAIAARILASGGALRLNSEEWITASGTWTAKATGWHEVFCVGGGNGGHAMKAANNASGAEGGTSGRRLTRYVYLEAGTEVDVIIGAAGLGFNRGTGLPIPDSLYGGPTSFGDISTEDGDAYVYQGGRDSSTLNSVGAAGGGPGGGSYFSDGAYYGAGGGANVSSSGISAYNGYQGGVLVRWYDPAKAAGPLPAPALLSARRMAPRAAAAPATVNLYDPATGRGSVWREEDAEAQLARGLISEAAWLEICEAKAAEERAAWLADPETEAERFEMLRAARDARLAATDYLTAADYPLAEDARAEVTAYRQALRDLPGEDCAPWDGGGEATPWPDAPTAVAGHAAKADAEVAPAVEAVPEIPIVEAPESPPEGLEEA